MVRHRNELNEHLVEPLTFTEEHKYEEQTASHRVTG